MIRIELQCMWCGTFVHPSGPMYAWCESARGSAVGPYCSRDCAERDAYGPARKTRRVERASLAKRKAVLP